MIYSLIDNMDYAWPMWKGQQINQYNAEWQIFLLRFVMEVYG